MVSIDIDWTLILQLINFLVMIWALNTVLFKPVRSILAQRAAKKAEMNHNINATLDSLSQREERIAEADRLARQDGASAREEIRVEARSQERQLMAQAAGESAAVLKAARQDIINEIDQAKGELMAEVQSFSRLLAEKVLGRAI